jgi:nicotinamidase-related amidase
MDVPDSFFERCVFCSIDLQEGEPPQPCTEETLPPAWREAGITPDDANAATRFLQEVALPNARRVADACRALGLPMIFVHWGYLFRDAMDLDPVIAAEFLRSYGPDRRRWPHHIDDPTSRPAAALGVRPGEYVLPKTAQDAFASSNIDFLLRNLDCRHIVFVGGHTNACLGRTADSARERGYITLCVADATYSAAESWRLRYITGRYDYVVSTTEFLALTAAVGDQR